MFDYVCGVCDTVSHHTTRAEAEDEREGHRHRVHHGRTPVREWIRDHAALAALDARPRPGMPVPLGGRVVRWLVGTGPGRCVLAVAAIWLVFFVNSLPPPR